MKLLCIDDELQLAELRCMVLRANGLECVTCLPTLACLELHSGNYDVLILSAQINEAETEEMAQAAAENAVIMHLDHGDAGKLLEHAVLQRIGLSIPSPSRSALRSAHN
ncbi:MAG: hypothetical protein NVS9B15_21070 [Acidobacteriaceae bacterium]